MAWYRWAILLAMLTWHQWDHEKYSDIRFDMNILGMTRENLKTVSLKMRNNFPWANELSGIGMWMCICATELFRHWSYGLWLSGTNPMISIPQIRPRCYIHYDDVLMSSMASQITSLASVYSTFIQGAVQRKYQSSASLAFVRGIHRWPVNSPHKGPVTRKMIPFDDVIMINSVLKKHGCDNIRHTCLSPRKWVEWQDKIIIKFAFIHWWTDKIDLIFWCDGRR